MLPVHSSVRGMASDQQVGIVSLRPLLALSKQSQVSLCVIAPPVVLVPPRRLQICLVSYIILPSCYHESHPDTLDPLISKSTTLLRCNMYEYCISVPNAVPLPAHQFSSGPLLILFRPDAGRSSNLSAKFGKSIEINGVRSISTVASQSQRLVSTYKYSLTSRSHLSA